MTGTTSPYTSWWQYAVHEHTEDHDKTAYVNVIVDTIISTGRADDFIIAIANVIQRLAIDQLHILGDIYDRGPGAHIILDKMRRYHSWDIQWGNHDVLWMGAAAGNDACICNVIRLSLRYANLSTLEEGYGINLVTEKIMTCLPATSLPSIRTIQTNYLKKRKF